MDFLSTSSENAGPNVGWLPFSLTLPLAQPRILPTRPDLCARDLLPFFFAPGRCIVVVPLLNAAGLAFKPVAKLPVAVKAWDDRI